MDARISKVKSFHKEEIGSAKPYLLTACPLGLSIGVVIMLCDVCGKDKEDVEVVDDPYLKDIAGINESIAICQDCYEDKKGDI